MVVFDDAERLVHRIVRCNGLLDEDATRSGFEASELVSCGHMPALWCMLTVNFSGVCPCVVSLRVRPARVY
jgi:hypothetical protein